MQSGVVVPVFPFFSGHLPLDLYVKVSVSVLFMFFPIGGSDLGPLPRLPVTSFLGLSLHLLACLFTVRIRLYHAVWLRPSICPCFGLLTSLQLLGHKLPQGEGSLLYILHIYIYIYIYSCLCVYIHIYICTVTCHRPSLRRLSNDFNCATVGESLSLLLKGDANL